MFTPLVQQLIDNLRCLAGIGPKSAQRIAFQLLERQREAGLRLAQSLKDALTEVQHCERCRNFSEKFLCALCEDSNRNSAQLCVVETPADVFVLEQTRSYRGLYFVLMGHLSPLDGIGPDELHIPLLKRRIQEGTLQELILATNPTVEGEATAHYISNLVRQTAIRCSRIAHGVPMDGDLSYLDAGTLAHAITARTYIT